MIRQMEQPFTMQAFARLLFQYRKQATVYALSFVIISLNLCFFLQADLRTPAAETGINVVQLCCFVLMGIINCWLCYKRNIPAGFVLPAARLAFICLLFVIIASALFIYYWFTGNGSLVIAFASGSAFLLPFLLCQGWIAYREIPAKQYSVWWLPVQSSEYSKVLASAGNNLQVQLIIDRRGDHAAFNTFPVTTVRKMKLGKLFERFVDEQQMGSGDKHIKTTDENGACGWQFFEQQWGGLYNRNLNPLQSLLENYIKPNAKIIVRRVAAGTR